MGTPGFVRLPERFDPETLLKVLGANSGNLMFQYAATRLIDAPLVHVGQAETPYSDIGVLHGAQALVFPAANHLRLGADWTGLCNYLTGAKKPLIIFGLGAQSPKIGGEAATVAALKADPGLTRFVDILRDRAVFVSVRGAFSAAVCAEMGLKDVHVLGCPSAFINPDPGLGRALQAKLARAQAEGARPRIGMTAAAPFEIAQDEPKRALEQRLIGWTAGADGLYFQQSGGLSAMLAANGRWYQLGPHAHKSLQAILAPKMDPVAFWAFMAGAGRFHLSAPDWTAEAGQLDVTLGTRLHGNMAAIAGGTPGVLIAHDSRTGELGQTMHLPHLEMQQAMAAPDLGSALRHVVFDGAGFDAWRAAAARQMAAAFARIGVPLAPHVHRLAGQAAA
jgi:hypothetical protein